VSLWGEWPDRGPCRWQRFARWLDQATIDGLPWFMLLLALSPFIVAGILHHLGVGYW